MEGRDHGTSMPDQGWNTDLIVTITIPSSIKFKHTFMSHKHCDFVLWVPGDLYIERITPDEVQNITVIKGHSFFHSVIKERKVVLGFHGFRGSL